MKYFTIICSVLLVLLMAGALVFVGMSPDFVAPGAGGTDSAGPDEPVWDMTMDDILNYFVEKGFINSVDDAYFMSSGVGTEGRGFDNAEIYWWDVDDLAEGSDEAAAWEDMNTEGVIDLWQQGTVYMAVTPNGPFGISLTYYTGDTDALLKAFQEFGHNGGATSDSDDRSGPVWSKSLDELQAYMVENGFIEEDKVLHLSLDGNHFTDGIVANGLELYWWDLDNLAEGSAELEAYESAKNEGIIVYNPGFVGSVTINGPFGMLVTYYEGDAAAVSEAFENFGQ